MNNLSPELKANEIHERAVGFYKISEQYGYKFLMEVKTIRDEKLYKELGFETFEDYTRKVFGYTSETIRQRIKAAEVFGEDETNARWDLGTRKLNTLATFPENERNKVLEHGIQTDDGNKTIDEATTRELEKYKKQLKQRDEQNAQLQSQVEQAQRSEEIAKKQLEDAESREPEVIEKYMEPEDYNQLKQSNQQLQDYLQEVSNHNKQLKSDIEKLKNERSETDEKSAKYDQLNEAINKMNGQLTKGQQKIKAQKEVYDLVRASEKLIKEVSPLCYLAYAKDIVGNEYAREPIERIIKNLKDISNRLQKQINQGDVIDV
ncbi:hypothetical protein RCI17_09425 [Staphylococcus haemolyticus]|uniref:hypothetical protein n=1 Tax=Staphylococcus haemolyticus TaxID=1283 RepID=UPI0027EAF90A|nr:hypothetical protein [Staphylococcus haemolyticus]MDQ7226939.1 hypothetical protein [Staphylococcus haemolyticus]